MVPLITYGSEILGPDVHKLIGRVHCKYCKYQQGVGSHTSNPAVLGECGRDRIYVACSVKCIKFWLKIITSLANSLLRSCYRSLFRQIELGKINWASKVKHIMYSYGFGEHWENLEVTNHVAFIQAFTQRVQDCKLQLWSADIHGMPKLRLYSKFIMTREEELYLSLSIPRRLRSNLAHYKTSSHCLEIEVGRHHNVAPEDRLCKLCGEANILAVEDEYHVLFHCPTYQYQRTVYISNNGIGLPNEYNFIKYLQTEDQEKLIDLANFISSMFKTSHQSLSANVMNTLFFSVSDVCVAMSML